MFHWRAAFVAVLFAGFLVACGGGTDKPVTPPASISPPPVTLTVTSTVTSSVTSAVTSTVTSTVAAAESSQNGGTSSWVTPPVTLPPLAGDNTLLGQVPVEVSLLTLELRPFATFPNSSLNKPPRLNVLAHFNNRMFVGDETDGKIYEMSPSGTVTLWFDVAAAMLSSTGRKLNSLPANIHSGLRSIAFHPNFNSNGRFYTSVMEDRPSNPALHKYISDVPNPVEGDSVLIEWRANIGTMAPITNSYREVFRVGVPVYDHPIKQITFRPGALPGDADYGALYVGHGDGSVQSVTVGGGMANDGRGKILRVFPLQSGTQTYTIPPSNPFITSTVMIKEAYSIGHRNPHHLAFANDGTLLVAEAGRDNINEVNLITPGANYGWPVREGTLVHLAGGTLYDGVAALPANDACNNYTYPVMQMLHQGVRGTGVTGQALGGGYVVENGSVLSGHYFSTDFVFSGDVFSTRLSAMKAAITKAAPASLRMAPIARVKILFDHDNNPNTAALALPNLKGVTSLAPNYDSSNRVDMRFGQGPNGEMYLLSKRDRRVYLVTNSVAPTLTTNRSPKN